MASRQPLVIQYLLVLDLAATENFIVKIKAYYKNVIKFVSKRHLELVFLAPKLQTFGAILSQFFLRTNEQCVRNVSVVSS